MAFDATKLLQSLTHGDADARQTAAQVLGRQGVLQALGPLTALLHDRESLVRAAAVEALGRLGQAESGPRVLPLLRDRSEWVRAAAAETLGHLVYLDATAPLLKALGDREYLVRGWSAWALGRFPALPSPQPVVDLLRDPVQWVRERAHDTLLAHWDAEVGLAVAGAAGHRDAMLRRNVARILGDSGRPTSVDVLLRLLGDRVVEVRVEVARSLAQLRPPAAVPLLHRSLERDPDDRVRAASASALGAIGGPTVVPLLSAAVHDQSDWVRRNAAWALLHLGTEEADAVLETMREDADDAAAFFASLTPEMDRRGRAGAA